MVVKGAPGRTSGNKPIIWDGTLLRMCRFGMAFRNSSPRNDIVCIVFDPLTIFVYCMCPYQNHEFHFIYMYVDDTGLHITNCTCPEPCETHDYGIELSYAPLASISMRSILQRNTTTLEKKYRAAQEIRNVNKTVYLYSWCIFVSNYNCVYGKPKIVHVEA